MIHRRKPLPRPTKPIARSPIKAKKRSAIPRVSLVRKAKRRAEYTAYLRSPEWKAKRAACLKRADYQCEFIVTTHLCGSWRCPETEKLTAHHLTYARFGGRELPKDLQCLCKLHHDYVEALKGKRGKWLV